MSGQQFRFTVEGLGPLVASGAFHPLATIIGQELDRIGPAEGGIYRATEVIEYARDKSNPLHQFFEWDDAAAATKYRQDQATALVHSVVQCP